MSVHETRRHQYLGHFAHRHAAGDDADVYLGVGAATWTALDVAVPEVGDA